MLLNATHVHGKALQALANARERKYQGRLMGEVKRSWKRAEKLLVLERWPKRLAMWWQVLSCWISSSQGMLLTAQGREMKLFQLIRSNQCSLPRAAHQRPLLYLCQAIWWNDYFLPEVSPGAVLWKSSNVGDETLGKAEHAHSVLHHHTVKFSPPSDLINSVYKFLGMSP